MKFGWTKITGNGAFISHTLEIFDMHSAPKQNDTVKVLLYTNDSGGYSATLLEDEEASDFENDGCCVVAVSASTAYEWSDLCDKMKEFQGLWKTLSNEWYDGLGINPNKG